MKRAAYYSRVSTPGQEVEATIESQKDEIEHQILEDGNTLVDGCAYSDNGYSGEILARPDLDRMRYDAKHGKFDVLYVYDRGRLARKYVYQEIVIEEITDMDIEFITLHDMNAITAEDKVTQGMQGLFAEYEKIKIAERFRRGKMYKVRSGKLLGYCPKYGYDYVKTSEKEGDFRINTEEAANVKMIFNWVGNEGVSLREVIRRLYAAGIKPKKHKRDQWTTGPLTRMLRDETYIGNHFYNKSESVVVKKPKDPNAYRRFKKTGRKARPKEEWILHLVEPIVTEEVFYKVQERLKLNLEFSKRNTKNEYLSQGLIYCSCGQKRIGDISRGKKYYRCTDRQKRFPLPKICNEGTVNAELVDKVIWNHLVAFLTSEDKLRDHIKRFLNKKIAIQEQNTSDNYTAINREMEKLEMAKEKYAVAFGMGEINIDLLHTLNSKVDSKISILKDRISIPRAVNKEKCADDNNSEEEIYCLAKDMVTSGLSFENRQATLRMVINRIIANKQKIIVSGSLPLPEKVGLSSNSFYRWFARQGH